MSGFFRNIRKKKNFPRLITALFLLLMMVEIFGHAQKEFNNLIAERPPNYLSIQTLSENGEIIIEEFEVCSFGKSLLWSDQASHHQVLVTNFLYNFKRFEITYERIPFNFADSLYKSLAPPYLPPELI